MILSSPRGKLREEKRKRERYDNLISAVPEACSGEHFSSNAIPYKDEKRVKIEKEDRKMYSVI